MFRIEGLVVFCPEELVATVFADDFLILVRRDDRDVFVVLHNFLFR